MPINQGKNSTSSRYPTRSQSPSLERQPNEGPTLSGASFECENMAEAIRNGIEEALLSKTFHSSLVESLVPAIAEAVRETICNDLHQAFQTELDKKQAQLDEAMKQITSLRNEISSVHSLLDAQEQYSRRNCLRIHGIPESGDEASTDDLIVKLATEKLNVNITKDQIDRSHRISPKPRPNQSGVTTGKPRAIIVKFSTYNIRHSFYKARVQLKGTGIYINEDLTTKRQELFTIARRNPNVKRSWTSDGTIFVVGEDGNRRKIVNKSDLEKL